MALLDALTQSSLVILVLTALGFSYFSPKKESIEKEKCQREAGGDLKRKYLICYGLAVLGDWLQGPYVYRLYMVHGLAENEIHSLFVCGFLSACLLGPFMGVIWDKCGRLCGIRVYGLMYAASCFLTAHGTSFSALILGRILGGTSTAILFSVFEAWLVSQSGKLGLSGETLGEIFTKQTIVNSLIAVSSGLVAQSLADFISVESVFDLAALVCLGVAIFAGQILQEENYGQAETVLGGFSTAMGTIMSSWPICAVGLVQSLFEGAMYAFVLMWTPALSIEGDDIPHGLIFSALMLAMLNGSLMNDRFNPRLEVVLGCSAFALTSVSILSVISIRFAAFLTFESCVGAFWPLMAGLRSKLVPEESRCAVLSLFRVPLNLIVIWLLSSSLALEMIFAVCGAFLLVTVLILINIRSRIY